MSNRFRILIPTLALAAGLAGPAAAQADTYCVNKQPCLLGHTYGPGELQQALTDAGSNLGPDSVVIGPKATPYVGPFHYGVGAELNIHGTAAGSTILTGPAGSPVLDLPANAVTVRDLEIAVTSAPGADGLRLGGTAEGVAVRQVGNPANGIPTGVTLLPGSLFSAGTVETKNGAAVETEEPGTRRIERSTITSTGSNAIRNGFGLAIDHSTLEGSGIAVDTFTDDAALDLDTTVVRTDDNGIYVTAAAELTARHVTIAQTGSGSGRGLFVQPFSNVNAPPTTALLESSVISGFDESTWRAGTVSAAAEIALRHSAWDGEIVDINDYGTTDVSTGNLPGTDPGFAGATDLRLGDGSALIDAGDPAEAAGTDLAGDARPLDGNGDGAARSDIGAYEHGAVAPPPPPVQPGGDQPGGVATARVGKRGLRARAGRVPVRISCPAGGGGCLGEVGLLSRDRPLGARGFELAAGGRTKARVKLARSARRALARRGSLRTRVLVTSQVSATETTSRAARTKILAAPGRG